MEQENKQFKMLSLFSGSGGFELCGTLCGIEPVAASEIEPFPIKVTKARFPNMKHLGDISKINGADLEPVDVVTGGSPCQDMSIAGKRQGMSKKCPKCGFSVVGNDDIKLCPDCSTELEYTRSGLFMEQIRVIKEMREKDARNNRGANEHIRPRFMLWENVVGAFSSNKGEDFRAVLEETARIVDKTATIPRPKNGKWNTDGCIMGNGYSIAWRVLDAQYWGVPQRRRRIALVADFAGQCAGEILFKYKGLYRNFTESRKAWQSITGDFAQGIGETSQYSVDFGRTADRIQMNASKAVTLLGEGGGGGAKTGLYCLPKPIAVDGYNQEITGSKTRTLTCQRIDVGNVPLALEPKFYDVRISSDGTKNARAHCYETSTSRTIDSGGCNPDSNHGGVAICEPKCYSICSYDSNSMKSDNPNSGIYEAKTSRTLDLNGGNPACNQGGLMICEPVIAFEPGIAKREGADSRFVENCTPTIRANMGDNQVSVAYKKGIVAIEGNGARPSHKGDGYKESDVMYTLNATEQHGVAYEKTYQQTTDSLMTNSHPGSYTGQDAMNNDMFVVNEYIVRRLTPLECSRLQGFPDTWLDNIAIENPTEEDMQFWREVFETHRNVVTGAAKPKTDKQIIKWLKEPDTDGAKYKLWGNGIALPCFLYVMQGIKEVLDRTSNNYETAHN